MRPLLALAAATGLACLAQGATGSPISVPANPLVQQAYWYNDSYCGPECQRNRYWAHRRWEHRRSERERYYGHNYPSTPYYYRY